MPFGRIYSPGRTRQKIEVAVEAVIALILFITSLRSRPVPYGITFIIRSTTAQAEIISMTPRLERNSAIVAARARSTPLS